MVQYRRDIFRLIEAACVGTFFVQAVRFLYMTLYAHVSSASLVNLTQNQASIVGVPGVVMPLDVQTELVIVGIAIFVPLLSIIFSRLWFGPTIAAIAVAVGRVFMTSD